MDLTTLGTQFGIGGVTIYIAYKIISQLYSDMREDSVKREERLMVHMEKQSDIMSEISDTLKTMDNRVCNLEECFKERKYENN